MFHSQEIKVRKLIAVGCFLALFSFAAMAQEGSYPKSEVFAGYQYTTLRSDPKNVQAWIPTPQMLAGDWTTFASAGCNNNRAITLRAPFVNNRIDPARFS